MDGDVIVTHGLTKIYGRQLGKGQKRSLDNLNLTVRRNEDFGFLGRNGAGKTTTIKILCSLLRPTSGWATVHGEPVTRRIARRAIGFLPENPYFYEYLTPRETLDFYGKLHGLSPTARKETWERIGERLDLHRIADQRIRGFSKGMRQRLGFAVALVGDPPVLILDEPMSGLDPLGRRNIRELILQMRGEGKTVFFSSHVLGDVEQICDRVGILVDGRLTTQGRIDDLLSRHIRHVEIILEGLTADQAMPLANRALHTRISEAGRHFVMDNAESADALVRDAYQMSGVRLVEFSPIRESLEDYFMREQETGS